MYFTSSSLSGGMKMASPCRVFFTPTKPGRVRSSTAFVTTPTPKGAGFQPPRPLRPPVFHNVTMKYKKNNGTEFDQKLLFKRHMAFYQRPKRVGFLARSRSNVPPLVCWKAAQDVVDKGVMGPNDTSRQHFFRRGSRFGSYLLHEKCILSDSA